MIFVAGASGGLGNYIISNYDDVIGSHFSKPKEKTIYYDFSIDANLLKNISKLEAVISTVALTDVDYSEENPQTSFNITFQANKNLADMCSELKIPFIFISTNDVFDGNEGNYTEEKAANPINIYSKHKEMAEKYLIDHCEKFLILRTSILSTYSSFKNETLIKTIFKNILNKKENNLFIDSFNSPVHISSISKFIMNKDYWSSKKIIHLYSDRVSKVDIGQIASKVMKQEIFINKISMKDATLKAQRPKDVSLLSNFTKKYDIEEEVQKTYYDYVNNQII